MARKVISAAVLAASVATAVIPSVAMAQRYDNGRSYYDQQYRDGYGRDYYHRGSNGYYSRDASWDGRHYRGRNGYYSHRCGGGDGAVGTIVGAGGGALIGNALGGGLGTILGGVGGALLGRGLDKEHTRDRNGC